MNFKRYFTVGKADMQQINFTSDVNILSGRKGL